MEKRQNELFNAIKHLSHDVDNLASFVQNDFKMLLEDGYVTKSQIKQSAEQAAIRFDRCTTQLANLRTEVIALMAAYATSSPREKN